MRHVTLIMLILLLTACGQRHPSPVTSDRDIQKRLAATWIFETNRDGEQFRSITVIAPDGGYVAEATVVRSNVTQRFSESGTILAKDGVLIETMTRHSSTNARVPLVNRKRIVRLDDRELVVQYEERPDLEPFTFRRER